MQPIYQPGLGELLRHLTDLVDRGADAVYRQRGLNYRPRYTPVMRVLAEGPCTVGRITARLAVTQGAVSQTLKLMEADCLVVRAPGADARQTQVALSAAGQTLLESLRRHWRATFRAIDELEAETGIPLRDVLGEAIAALEQRGFAERIGRYL